MMLGRMAGPGGGGVSEQREAALDCSRHTGTAAAVSLLPPPKLFLDAGSGVSGEEEEAFTSPAGAIVVMVSPTSTLQEPTGNPTTPLATTAVPFSSHRGARARARARATSSSGWDRRRCKSSSNRNQRPWEARPVGVGLAGALSGDDALPLASTGTTVVLTGKSIRPGSPQGTSRRREMEASEAYTRVIERGPNTRTTHIFEDRVVVVPAVCECDGEDEFLRWCHGCGKDLGQGKDIFMYRGDMAFCSHECRYREMLLSDQEEHS